MLIVTRMNRTRFLVALLVLFLPISAQAQASAIGVSVGGGESLEDRLDFSLDDTVFQIYYETSFGQGTTFRAQYGTFDTQVEITDADVVSKVDSTVEFVNLIGQYEFDEVYGQSAIFGGLGFYRHDIEGFDREKDWGLVVGVNGAFPVTRRFALTAEAAYHWADFEENLSVIVFSVGAKIRF